MTSRNIMLSTDSYKHSHFLQYPPDAKFVSSYIEARMGDDPEQRTLFFGLQAFLVDYLGKPITKEQIEEAEEITLAHGLPFNRKGWEHILYQHAGRLPLEIQALPEGTLTKRGIPLVQIRNTDPEVPWLPSFIETALLRSVWYPSAVATLSFLVKAVFMHALNLSSDNTEDALPFRLHDFGARGVSSAESAALGGLAHLVNFQGTDTMEALLAARKFYGCKMAGFSVPASEHSTMTSWGRGHETDAYSNMIDQFGGQLFSVVSDSYDLFNAVDQIFGVELKDKIMAIPGRLVVRPDSGDPVTVPVTVAQKLWDHFGGTINSKGYKVLDPHVGLIQGDGMNEHKISWLLQNLMDAGFSAENVVVGMGGGLLQDHMRDDMRWAMKANAIDFGGGWVDVQKKPATDPSKTSKAGRQQVVYFEGTDELMSIREDDVVEHELIGSNLLVPVYRDGSSVWESFDSIRARANRHLLRFHDEVFPEEDQAEAA